MAADDGRSGRAPTSAPASLGKKEAATSAPRQGPSGAGRAGGGRAAVTSRRAAARQPRSRGRGGRRRRRRRLRPPPPPVPGQAGPLCRGVLVSPPRAQPDGAGRCWSALGRPAGQLLGRFVTSFDAALTVCGGRAAAVPSRGSKVCRSPSLGFSRGDCGLKVVRADGLLPGGLA